MEHKVEEEAVRKFEICKKCKFNIKKISPANNKEYMECELVEQKVLTLINSSTAACSIGKW